MAVWWVGGLTVGFAAAGVAAGAGVRLLLARLRRGAVVRPPVCELALGCGWAAVGAGWASGALPGRWAAVLLVLVWFGVALGLVDLRHRRLPDALTLPALPALLVALLPHGTAVLARAIGGAVLAVVVHAVVHLVAPSALGAGDVKLAAPLGAVLGAVSWSALPLAALLAAVLTAALALGTAAASALAAGPVPGAGPAAVRALARGDPVPHGPSMLLATALVTAAAAVGAGAG